MQKVLSSLAEVLEVALRSTRFQEVDRPAAAGGQERTKREEELQRQVEGDSAQGPVVKAKKGPSAPSLDEWDGHVAAGQAEYRGWCLFCVAGKGKSEAHRRMEASRRHGQSRTSSGLRPRRQRARRQSIAKFGGQVLEGSLVDHLCKGTQHRWTVGKLVNDVIMSGVQTLVVKSDQEVM